MKYHILFFLLFIFFLQVPAQVSSNLVYVDSQGKLKWTENKKDAYFFGVNYSLPFAFSYRALKNKNIPHKEIIDMDVQQFKRLGLNAYRIHVWDREISDKDGSLIINEHLELLDYLISKLIENNIYIILTPIAWWGAGWPEPDLPTPGFSSFYSKIESTTKPEVIKAHVNYLKQFVNHINSYTGKSYKNEPFIIGFEIINEPNLPKNSDSVKYYVNTTADAIREEGITKPVFFNISENPGKEQWEAVASSNIEGISFQWYPTGLVKYSELKGNFTPNAFSYPLPPLHPPFSKGGNEGGLAKMVYEFDAADIGKSYMYPLMAHSFKEAGMQWAAMFCYDPSAIAQYNSEYSTHYLNLLYTPQKALGFFIAAYLFNYEEVSEKKIDSSSVLMNNVLTDYDHDLSLLNTNERFYYSNSNNAAPKEIKELKHIAGYGSSKLINYDGRGAYFLDKISDDLWKLELFPDAVWIKDPFGRNGLSDPIAKLIWKSHKIKILLPGLISNFNIYNLNNNRLTASDFTADIEPGVYFLTNDSVPIDNKFYSGNTDFEKIKKYGEFINDFNSTEIKNLTPLSLYNNRQNKITAEVYSIEDSPV
ncbi:MAG TPA: cellulase family glycosylhydrolase, partial [Ignavibacteriaceae bacterium]|nr:cellulase family glycosylhydrolase [Ignavibacteriaceae bacterium]